MPANKAALSRALGAAFLSHQVEQLEKSVAQGATSGDWRDRRQKPESSPPRNGQRGIINMNHRLASPQPKPQAKPAGKKQTGELANGNALHDDNRSRRPSDPVIDVVVVDVSVLVHAIHQLKLWCRSDRKEKIIVPLEGTVDGSLISCCFIQLCLSPQHSGSTEKRDQLSSAASPHSVSHSRSTGRCQ